MANIPFSSTGGMGGTTGKEKHPVLKNDKLQALFLAPAIIAFVAHVQLARATSAYLCTIITT